MYLSLFLSVPQHLLRTIVVVVVVVATVAAAAPAAAAAGAKRIIIIIVALTVIKEGRVGRRRREGVKGEGFLLLSAFGLIGNVSAMVTRN